MGGQTTQQTQQIQQTQPYAPAAGAMQGILANVGMVSPQLSGVEQNALGNLDTLGAAGNQFAPQIGGVANTLLSGGGANNFAPMASDAYAQLRSDLNPYASGQYLNPYSTPGFGAALSTLNSDITNQINSQFAAAGRDMSGMNTQTLARGLSQGEGQLIANQYNQNVQNQLGAANALYGAGNSTTGLLAGLNQTALGNQQAGISAADAANQAQQYGPLLQLQAEAQRRGIPLQTMAAQMGITLPAAQAFSQQNGQSTTAQSVPLSQQLVGGAIGSLGLLGGLGAFGQNGFLNFSRQPTRTT